MTGTGNACANRYYFLLEDEKLVNLATQQLRPIKGIAVISEIGVRRFVHILGNPRTYGTPWQLQDKHRSVARGSPE